MHLLGRGIGRHIKILGRMIKQQIAHRTTDDIGLESGFLQAFAGFDGGLADMFVVNFVFAGRDDLRGRQLCMGIAPTLAKHFLQKLFNH